MTMGDERRHKDPKDHWAAAVELSNNCRRFYFNHMKTTEEFKKSIHMSRRCNTKTNGTVKSRLDTAMDKLRTEMAELMDQDLSLMEQLLTLNDKIEEVKHKYMYSVSKDSLGTSSCNISAYCTDSEMSLTSLDVNDYNEDGLFGSDLDVRDNVTVEPGQVFLEGCLTTDEAFKRWIKKQSMSGEEYGASNEDIISRSTRTTRVLCASPESMENLSQDTDKLPRIRSVGFIPSELPDSDVQESGEACHDIIDRDMSSSCRLVKNEYPENDTAVNKNPGSKEKRTEKLLKIM